MQATKKARVLIADGWGDFDFGSVFCADSSLRYIYEANAGESTASHISFGAKRNFHKKEINDDVQMMEVADFDGWDKFGAHGAIEKDMVSMIKSCRNIGKAISLLPFNSDECPVCLQLNACMEIRPCGHRCHVACFLRWYRIHKSCPLCRGIVDEVQVASKQQSDSSLGELVNDVMESSVEELKGDLQFSDSIQDDKELLAMLDTDMLILEGDEVQTKEHDTARADLEVFGNHHMCSDDNEFYENKLDLHVDVINETSTFNFPPSSSIPSYWDVLHEGMMTPKCSSKATVGTRAFIDKVPSDYEDHFTRSPAHVSDLVAQRKPQVSCRCTGGCRNGRCACIKKDGACSSACRCTSCKNPFSIVVAFGADLSRLSKDPCFMQNACKIRDMAARLQDTLTLPCCNAQVKILDCLHGYTCQTCLQNHEVSQFQETTSSSYLFEYTWCGNKLLNRAKNPKTHCAVCKRCVDHREQHCNDCNKCYFAGITGELPCSCQAFSFQRQQKTMTKQSTHSEQDDREDECTVM